jgi:hypothetical protein
MKAVNVFCGINSFEDALGVDLLRKGELDEYAVDIIVAVEVVDDAKHVERGGFGGRSDQSARQAELFAGGDFAFDVEMRSGIIAGENGGEARANAGGREHADFIAELFEDLITNFVAVENACGHQHSLSGKKQIITWQIG